MKKPLAPYCFSNKCIGKGNEIRPPILKENLKLSAIYCPDCGSVLVWKRLGVARNPGLAASKKIPN
jgi:hypothetical protein